MPRWFVLFLHGSGDTGAGVRAWVESLARLALVELQTELDVQFLFPTAEPLPYSLAGGAPSTVWHDRLALGPDAPEQRESAENSMQRLRRQLEEAGAAPENTIVGGFSMGGGLALQMAAAQPADAPFAACFALSSFLADDSAAWAGVEADGFGARQLLQIHGTADGLVHEAWGRATYERLSGLVDVPMRYMALPRVDHELTEEGLEAVVGLVKSVAGPGGGAEL